MKVIGTNIRARRMELGLSQAELAKLAGVHINTVSSLERVKLYNVVLDTLKKIAIPLQLSFAQLLSDDK